MTESNTAIKLTGVKKQYKLGQIGGGTLQGDLQSWWARKRGKEDPNSKIGTDQRLIGQTFMALNGIDLEIKQGEAVGIIGKNGAGKSTMLKLLCQVTAPTEGSIDIHGRIASMLEVGTGFHPEMTGRENVYMNGAILGMTKAEIDAKMDQIIEFSEVSEFIDTPVKRYSSGMYVKLAFSVAAHLDSEIMIMDEVLAVGDMKFQQKCLNKMRDAATTQGKTVLYVSHNMNTIRQLCDRCIVLSEGRVIFDGDVEEAIGVYLGVGKSKSNTIVTTPEMHEKDINKASAVIEKIEVDAAENMIDYGSDLKFSVDIKNRLDSEQDIYLRTMIKAADGTVITMSPSSMPVHLNPNEKVHKQYKINTENIVPGNYTISFVLYEIGMYGTDKNQDILRDVYSFVIKVIPGFNHDMPWNPRWWGYISVGELTELQ